MKFNDKILARTLVDISSRIRLPGFRRMIITDQACRAFGMRPRGMIRAGLASGWLVNVVPNPFRPASSNNKSGPGNVPGAPERIPHDIAVYPSCIELECLPDQLDPGDSHHQNVLNKWIREVEGLWLEIEDAARRVNPHCMVYFQGYLPDSAVLRRLAISGNIPFVALERSAFARRLLWDTISGIAVNQNLARNFFWRMQDSISDKDALETSAHYLKTQLGNKQEEHESPGRDFHYPDLSGNGKRILFIGQVYTDSSIIFGMRKNMDPVSVISGLAGLSRENGHFLAVKLHPKEHGGNSPLQTPYDNLTYRKLKEANGGRELSGENGYGLVDQENQYNTFQLIRDADIVITLNSQAGLEAAIMGKPVIVLGEAFYGNMGFTIDVRNLEDLLSVVENFSPAGHDIRAVELMASRFFHVFLGHYSIEASPAALFKLLNKQVV